MTSEQISPSPPLLITDQSAWNDFLPALRSASRIGVDMESNGFHRYRERICLIQLAVGETVALVDPLTVEDISGLGKIFADPAVEKIFHSADYDLRSFDRDYGFHVQGLFDTSVAAGFLGTRMLGLGNVLSEHLGVDIPKSKKIQRHDWGRRPLTEEAIGYAASDVRYLFPLRDRLWEGLDNLGRTAWVREECERLQAVRHEEREPPERAFHSAKGANRLSPRERAIFREIYLFREEEARKLDRPPFKLFSTETMFLLAKAPETELEGLAGLPTGSRAAEIREAIRHAIERGKKAVPVPKISPVRTVPWNRFQTPPELAPLKEWRQRQGEILGIDPAFLWPARSLEALARTGRLEPEDSPAPDGGHPLIRRWQMERFGEDILDFFSGLRSNGGGRLKAEG